MEPRNKQTSNILAQTLWEHGNSFKSKAKQLHFRWDGSRQFSVAVPHVVGFSNPVWMSSEHGQAICLFLFSPPWPGPPWFQIPDCKFLGVGSLSSCSLNCHATLITLQNLAVLFTALCSFSFECNTHDNPISTCPTPHVNILVCWEFSFTSCKVMASFWICPSDIRRMLRLTLEGYSNLK